MTLSKTLIIFRVSSTFKLPTDAFGVSHGVPTTPSGTGVGGDEEKEGLLAKRFDGGGGGVSKNFPVKGLKFSMKPEKN
jgi:hypothetical protein